MIRSITRWLVLGLTVCVAHASPAHGQTSPPFQVHRVALVTSTAAGELHGTVRDDRGAPLDGAIVSASARGTASVFALSDRDGRYVFRNLAPGAYFVRAYLKGYSSPRGGYVQVTTGARRTWPIALSRVAEERPPTVVAAGIGGAPVSNDPGTGEANTEVEWRLRNQKRGVLKDAVALIGEGILDGGQRLAFADVFNSSSGLVSLFDSVSGQINLLTTTSFDRPQDLLDTYAGPRPIAYVSLIAPLANGEWAVRGSMTQGDVASWILAGSFTRNSGGSPHQYDVGLSYATQRYQGGNAEALAAMRDASRNVGELYANDTWNVHPRLAISVGGRYASYDYLEDRFLLGGRVSVAYQLSGADPLRLRLTASHRERAPGAEEFEAPAGGPWLPPERTFSPVTRGADMRAEQVDVIEVAGERPIGTMVVEVRAFRQQITDQLVTVFGMGHRGTPTAATLGHYRVASAGDFENYGWGLSVAREVLGTRAAVDYTMTQTNNRGPSRGEADALAFQGGVRPDEQIHDITASVNSRVPATATRLLLLYKLSNAYAASDTLRPETGVRFEVQVNQEMPFLDFTGAHWEMLVGVRDLFRSELFEASVYDELLVVRAPKRVIAGVKVAF